MGGENQQSLTVGVETAGGVDTGNRQNLREGTPAAVGLWGELAEHAVGLVQQKGLQGSAEWMRRLTFRIGSTWFRFSFPHDRNVRCD
jgi:hypothetical protein